MKTIEPLAGGLLDAAKWAFATRRVAREVCTRLVEAVANARSGDLVLARVEALGSHQRLQLPTGRPSQLHPGDLVVVVCGDRYAPDQFEGDATLSPGRADLLAAGGVVGRMRQRHQRMSLPTRLAPLGLVARDDGHVVNVADHALPPAAPAGRGPVVVAVAGASMNAGKTVAGSSLAHGLARAGWRVAAVKATGTAAFNDYNAYVDAGPMWVGDFTDAGMVSTYRQPLARIEEGVGRLLDHAAALGAEVAVVELADGILQAETAALLRSPRFRERLGGCLLAVPDALSVLGGAAALEAMALEPAAVTGTISCSPLASAEATAATGLRVMGRDALCDPAHANALLSEITAGRWRPRPLAAVALAAA
ncbi:MAG: hypothetical protein ACFBWO_18515 [Paracoccaceae bacterium]